MVGLMLENDYKARVVVEVGFTQNDTVPSLQYHFGHWLASEFKNTDAKALMEIFKVAEANVNGILLFDKQYDYDCEAKITDNISIRKFCCDDETDKPYFVEFPKTLECHSFGECNLCYQKCPYDIQ